MISIDEIISQIKNSFTDKGNALMKNILGLKAVFCTGSSANKKDFSNYEYQDFDIHFYIDKSFLSKRDLDLIRDIFKDIVKQYESSDVALDYCIKDLPWKMIPRKRINIGLHGTVYNRLDFKKRLEANYILALNMFENSEVLVGQLNFPKRKITNIEFLTKPGGIGWLKEQFYRLVGVLDPQLPEMAIPIREVAVYFGLTPLIHYYYIKSGNTANRETSRCFFNNQESVPSTIKEAVNFIYKSKTNFEQTSKNAYGLLEATHRILNYVANAFETKSEVKFIGKDVNKDEHSDIISKLLCREISVTRRLYYFYEDEFFAVLNTIKNISANFTYISPDDFVVALSTIIKDSSLKEVSRLYFFKQNDLRSVDETDFVSLEFFSLIYSWEKGIATYIQRLNENYLNSNKITEKDVMLAKVLACIGYSEFCRLTHGSFDMNNIDLELGLQNSFSYEENYFKCINYLVHIGDSANNIIKLQTKHIKSRH